MKPFLHTSIAILGLAALAAAPQALAYPQQQQIETKITAMGDADISIKINFDAQGWQTWKQTVGENPSILKRELERMFSTMVLSDYKLDRNDLEREITFHIHAGGVARYLGNNRWETDMDVDSMQGAAVTRRKLNDTTYFVSMAQSGPQAGIVMQQEMTVSLPEGASKLTEATSEMGTSVLRYDFEPPIAGATFSWPRAAAGSLLCLFGIASLLFAWLSGKSKQAANPNVTVLEQPDKQSTISA